LRSLTDADAYVMHMYAYVLCPLGSLKRQYIFSSLGT